MPHARISDANLDRLSPVKALGKGPRCPDDSGKIGAGVYVTSHYLRLIWLVGWAFALNFRGG